MSDPAPAPRDWRAPLALAAMLAMLAADAWAFRAVTGKPYFDWYLTHGSLISLATSLVTIGWGDVNRSSDLISMHPARYLATQFHIGGVALFALGAALRKDGTAATPARFADGALTVVVILPLIVAFPLWLFLVVPAQYVVYLACGAPARLAKSSTQRPVAGLDDQRLVDVRMIPRDWPLDPNYWEAGIDKKPVTTTTLIAAAVLQSLDWWRPEFLKPLLAL